MSLPGLGGVVTLIGESGIDGALLAGYLYILGRVRLRPPRLERWLEGEGPAFDSPPLAAGISGEGRFAPLDI